MKKNTKMYSTAIAAALATSTLVSVVPTQAESVTFKDVDKSSQFYNYIINLAERGIVEGDGKGNFHPKLDVRRDHAAKIIAGVLGLNTTNVVNPQFKDVSTNHPQYGAIAALKEAGIISGDGTGNYLPTKDLTRGEMAKIIANAFDLEVPADSKTPFTDVKGNMFEQYITALYVNGVTNGVGNNKFNPSGVVTREQLAAFIVRAEEIVAGEVVDKAGSVQSIDGDTIVVNGEVLVLTEELKAVFNEKNAAALKNAKVELVVRYSDAPVASLAPIANNAQGKVVGINGVELPNADTTFNASGFVIPTVSVTAKGVTISKVSVSTFTVAKGATVTLENVLADTVTVEGTLTLGEGSSVSEIIVTGDAKITVDKGATIESVTLDEGKTLKDVITNYDEVKELLKDVVVETAKPSTGGTGGTGGGTGDTGGGTTGDTDGNDSKTLEETIESVLQLAVDKYKTDYTYAEPIVDKSVNVLKFEIVDGSTKLAKVKSDMLAFETANSVADIIIQVPGIGTLYDNLESITANGVTYEKAQLLNRNFTKQLIISFVDANQGAATTIGELEGKETAVTVNFTEGSLVYKLKIVDEVK